MNGTARTLFCWGRKVNGDPCFRRASGYCWQHRDQARRRVVASGRITKREGVVVYSDLADIPERKQ